MKIPKAESKTNKKTCESHGYVNVEFQNLESWFRVVLRKTGDGDFIKPHDKADAGKTPQKSSLKILEILSKEPTCTYDELAEKLGVSRRALTKKIKNLREEGKLRRIGPDKGGHWEVMPT